MDPSLEERRHPMIHRTRIRKATLFAISIMVVGFLARGPSAGAAFPGGNGRIAFADFMTGQLYASNPDGSGLEQLTNVPRHSVALHPAWSADASHIAFESNETGDFELYVMGPDGGNRRRITRNPRLDDFQPSWYPSGRKLAFSQCTRTDPSACAISTVRLDGSHLRHLTPFKDEVFETASSVAPDGTRVAFTQIGARGVVAETIVIKADGTDRHHVTPARIEAFGPDWSPDGDRLVFHSACCKFQSAIYSTGADGSNLTRLTHARYPHSDYLPAFSPDGERIVFGSDRRYRDLCCSDLFVARTDGSHRRRITPDGTGAIEAAWGSAPFVAKGSTLDALPALERAVTRGRSSSLDPRACHGLIELTFRAGGCPLDR
jgi:Tol biopolymer transport system component